MTEKKKDYPVCLSGSIRRAPELSFCMDGATHLLHTIPGDDVRLKAANEKTLDALEEFTGAKCIVTVCGVYRATPECSGSYLLVTWVGAAGVFVDQIPIETLYCDDEIDLPHGNSYVV